MKRVHLSVAILFLATGLDYYAQAQTLWDRRGIPRKDPLRMLHQWEKEPLPPETSSNQSPAPPIKVGLHESCNVTENCLAPNSFCGFSDSGPEDSEQCLCADGYTDSANHTSCELIVPKPCNINTTNEDLLSGGCPSRMFCRELKCLCKPNYEFTPESGKCEWTLSDQEAPVEEAEPTEVLAILPPPQGGLSKWNWILFFKILGGVALIVAIFVAYAFYKRREMRLEKEAVEKALRGQEMMPLNG